MSDLLAYLRWRIIIGLAMVLFSSVVLSNTGIGVRAGYSKASEAEIEEARQRHEQYEAEREIRRARQTGGYDPSNPALIRDGYSSTYDSSPAEPYAVDPSE